VIDERESPEYPLIGRNEAILPNGFSNLSDCLNRPGLLTGILGVGSGRKEWLRASGEK